MKLEAKKNRVRVCVNKKYRHDNHKLVRYSKTYENFIKNKNQCKIHAVEKKSFSSPPPPPPLKKVYLVLFNNIIRECLFLSSRLFFDPSSTPVLKSSHNY